MTTRDRKESHSAQQRPPREPGEGAEPSVAIPHDLGRRPEKAAEPDVESEPTGAVAIPTEAARVSMPDDVHEPPASAAVPYHVADHIWHRVVKGELVYALAGLVLGLICVIGGLVLFMNGIAGSTSWTAKSIGAESEVSDAAPGAILFIVGLFIVFLTRYKVKAIKPK